MSDFFHNLSMQGLAKFDDKISINFDNVSLLVKNINSLLQKRL